MDVHLSRWGGYRATRCATAWIVDEEQQAGLGMRYEDTEHAGGAIDRLFPADPCT